MILLEVFGDNRPAAGVFGTQLARSLHTVKALLERRALKAGRGELKRQAVEQAGQGEALDLFGGVGQIARKGSPLCVAETVIAEELLREPAVDVHVGLLLVER